MKGNPFDDQVRAAELKLLEKEDRLRDLAERLALHDAFDREAVEAQASQSGFRLDELTAQKQRADREKQALSHSIRSLKKRAALGWKPSRWPSKRRLRARALVNRRQDDLDQLNKHRRRTGRKISSASKRLAAARQSIGEYDGFDRPRFVGEVTALKAEIELDRLGLDDLRLQRAALDDQLRAPVEELRRQTKRLKRMSSAAHEIDTELSVLEGRHQKAQDLEARMTAADSSRERAIMHRECDDLFDVSSPRQVLAEVRTARRRLAGERQQNRRAQAGVKRDIEKLERRIEVLALRAVRNIQVVVVDGKNLCFERDHFIGLSALIALCHRLAESYAVTVVFDASIRRDLRMDDAELARTLDGVHVHVVTRGTSADETILSVADDPAAYIVSNDRFAEFPEKSAVRGQRILRHEIIHGRVLVHDLGIDEPFYG